MPVGVAVGLHLHVPGSWPTLEIHSVPLLHFPHHQNPFFSCSLIPPALLPQLQRNHHQAPSGAPPFSLLHSPPSLSSPSSLALCVHGALLQFHVSFLFSPVPSWQLAPHRFLYDGSYFFPFLSLFSFLPQFPFSSYPCSSLELAFSSS